MKGDRIRYKTGYKYQLVNDYVVGTLIRPSVDIETEFIQLNRSGVLTIRHGYAWDGPSGPTIDTLNFMRGSLVHDALYQLIRDGYIEKERWRDVADRELQKICIEDGMSCLRAEWVYQAVKYCGHKSCCGDGGKKLTEAP